MPSSVRLGDHGQRDQKCKDVRMTLRNSTLFKNSNEIYSFIAI